MGTSMLLGCYLITTRDVDFQNIDGRAPLNDALCHDLSKGDQPQVAKLLLEHGANPNARDSGHKAPLHFVPSSKLGAVRILLEHGADVDAEDKEGRTPFLAALA